MIHRTVLLQRVENIFYIRNWIIAKIDYHQYHCSDCSQPLCLEIKNKIKSLYKLYNLVETLNTNNEDLDKCCGVSTDFISKLTDFFHNHWWKGLNKHSMEQNELVKKIQCWHVYMDPCTYSWMTILHILVKNQTFWDTY